MAVITEYEACGTLAGSLKAGKPEWTPPMTACCCGGIALRYACYIWTFLDMIAYFGSACMIFLVNDHQFISNIKQVTTEQWVTVFTPYMILGVISLIGFIGVASMNEKLVDVYSYLQVVLPFVVILQITLNIVLGQVPSFMFIDILFCYWKWLCCQNLNRAFKYGVDGKKTELSLGDALTSLGSFGTELS